MAMNRVLPLLLLLALNGCIGHTLGQPQLSMAEAYAQIQQGYDKFVGLPGDGVIVHYGAPSRTAKLDMGVKILEYSSKRVYLLGRGRRDTETCTLRFWIAKKKIIKVDDIGEREICAHFVTTKERYELRDLRDDYTPPSYGHSSNEHRRIIKVKEVRRKVPVIIVSQQKYHDPNKLSHELHRGFQKWKKEQDKKQEERSRHLKEASARKN